MKVLQFWLRLERTKDKLFLGYITEEKPTPNTIFGHLLHTRRIVMSVKFR